MLRLSLLAFGILLINSCSCGEPESANKIDQNGERVRKYWDDYNDDYGYDRDYWRPWDDRDDYRDDRDDYRDDRDDYRDHRDDYRDHRDDYRDRWDRYDKFKCPSSYGAFPDTTDCASYYVCVRGRATRRRCYRNELFDKYKRKCMSKYVAVCDKGEKEITVTPKGTDTTSKEDSFNCPSVFGTYMHPTDCSKYYSCAIFIPTLKTCPKDELFDGVKLKCKNAKKVHCGSRQIPGISSPVTEAVTVTASRPSPTPIKTPKPSTSSPSPTPVKTPRPPTASPSPTPKITTPQPTIPEIDCDENDLDCIIDGTGLKPKWFKCPEDMGSYPHPSSNRLFIFCLNWKPSVKKCGQDLVYSQNLRTCIAV